MPECVLCSQQFIGSGIGRLAVACGYGTYRTGPQQTFLLFCYEAVPTLTKQITTGQNIMIETDCLFVVVCIYRNVLNKCPGHLKFQTDGRRLHGILGKYLP